MCNCMFILFIQRSVVVDVFGAQQVNRHVVNLLHLLMENKMVAEACYGSVSLLVRLLRDEELDVVSVFQEFDVLFQKVVPPQNYGSPI